MMGPSPAMQQHMRLEIAFEEYAVLPGLSSIGRRRKMQQAIDDMYDLADAAFNRGDPDALDIADLFIDYFSRGDLGLSTLEDYAGDEPPKGILSLTWEAANRMYEDASEKMEILLARQRARCYFPAGRPRQP